MKFIDKAITVLAIILTYTIAAAAGHVFTVWKYAQEYPEFYNINEGPPEKGHYKVDYPASGSYILSVYTEKGWEPVISSDSLTVKPKR